VLLHSGWGDSSIWLPLLARLALRYRVVRYDQRGFGRSPAPESPYGQLGDLMAVLDWCDVAEALVVGYSGGAGPATGLALASPERLRGLMLLAPGVEDYPWPEHDPYVAEFVALLTAGNRAGLVSLGLRTWASAGADEAAQVQVRGAVEAIFRVGELERPDPPVYGRLGQIRVPAIMVVGDRDYPMVRDSAAAIAGRIPDCRTVGAPGADHMLPLRIPDQIATLIDELDASGT
jgi:pimeloyl-ACP methyl ester carboxylesterase